MPYKLFNIRLGRMPNPRDYLNEPIEIYKAFIKRAGTRISSSNFNKYGENTQPPNLRIEIRLDINNQRALVASLQQVTNRLSSSNRIQLTRVVFEDWNPPDFVIEAHETATKCAVAFKEEIDAHQQTLANLLGNIDDFMWKFMIAVLRGAGFEPRIIWGILRDPIPNEITSLADACSPILRESITNFPLTPDYLERFVHCFYNCTIGKENNLLISVQLSNIWQSISDSRTG